MMVAGIQSSAPNQEKLLLRIGVIAAIMNVIALSLVLLPSILSAYRFHARPLEGTEVRLSQAGSASELVLTMDRDCAVSCERVLVFIVRRNQELELFNSAVLMMSNVKGLTWEILGQREVMLNFCHAHIDHYEFEAYSTTDMLGGWRIYLHKKCNKILK